jgi:hypothetical protein
MNQTTSTRKTYEIDGDQVVIVDGGLTYLWHGQPPLKVGDRVLLPQNLFSEMDYGPWPFPGTVIELGSTYTNTRRLRHIVSRAE